MGRLLLFFASLSVTASASTPWWTEHFDYPIEKPIDAFGWSSPQERDGKRDHFFVREEGNTFMRSSYIGRTEARYVYKEVDWNTKLHPWLRWRWRIRKVPAQAKILDKKRSDAPAQIYVLWKVGRRSVVIKYFWAASEKVGNALRQSNFLFGKLHGEVIRSGEPVGTWMTETRNVYEDYKKFFGEAPKGNARAIALLSDADETDTQSEADYDDFEILKTP